MVTDGPSICGDGGDDEHEIEGDDDLEGESLGGGDGGDSNAAGHEGVEDGFESEGGADGGGELGAM